MSPVSKKQFTFLEYAALEPRLLDLREYAVRLHKEHCALDDLAWDEFAWDRMLKPQISRLVGPGIEIREGESVENRLLLETSEAYETCINEILHAYEWGVHKTSSNWFETTNATASVRIRSIVADYAKLNELPPPESWQSPSDVKMVIGDLVADLFHLCRASGVSVEEIAATATGHYAEETEGDIAFPLFIDTVNPS